MAGTPDDALPVPEPLATSGAAPASGPGRRVALAAVLVVGVLVVGLAAFVVTRKDAPADSAADVQSGEEQPPALYAVRNQAVVELNPADGTVVRTVLDASNRRQGAGGFGSTTLAASPDGTTLYTDLAGDDPTEVDVVAVDVQTGAVRVVARNGRLPALSPDGRTIAFLHGLVTQASNEVHLVDVETGAERTIAVDASALPQRPGGAQG